MIIDVINHGHVLILKTSEYQIDIDDLNNQISQWLRTHDKTGDDVSRAYKDNDYIIISGHGTLTCDKLIEFIEQYLVGKVSYKYQSIRLPKSVQNKIPQCNVIGGGQYGGLQEDTDEIDPGVKPLVESINNVDGITTFSSCDGHNGKKALYVCFYSDDQQSAENAIYQLTTYCNEFVETATFDNISVVIDIQANYGVWRDFKGMYYTFKVSYSEMYKSDVDRLIQFISKKLR